MPVGEEGSVFDAGFFGSEGVLLVRRNLQPMILIHDPQRVADRLVAAVVDAFLNQHVEEVKVPLRKPDSYAFTLVVLAHFSVTI